jgi:hypothetical protein
LLTQPKRKCKHPQSKVKLMMALNFLRSHNHIKT